jgi:chorismate synthase
MMIGLGEPMFDKLESLLAHALFSIPAVKGVQFGTGFDGIHLPGSVFNDVLVNQTGQTSTNHAGGMSGGISNGNPLIIKVFVKPPSSIQKTQTTYNLQDETMSALAIGGRHDVCIARRAGIVLENMTAIVLADLYLRALHTHHGEK